MYKRQHTHQVKKTIPGETYIYSRYTDFFVPVDCDYLSMGIHPWYTETDFERQLGELEKAISKTNVIALGEAGIDRSRGLPVEKQIKVFIRQIEIAEKYSKPVIILSLYTHLNGKKKIIYQAPWMENGKHMGIIELALPIPSDMPHFIRS